MNHVSYYRNHRLRWGTIFPSLEARKDGVGECGTLVGKKQIESKDKEMEERGSKPPVETGRCHPQSHDGVEEKLS